jgi:hypothetical protein
LKHPSVDASTIKEGRSSRPDAGIGIFTGIDGKDACSSNIEFLDRVTIDGFRDLVLPTLEEHCGSDGS